MLCMGFNDVPLERNDGLVATVYENDHIKVLPLTIIVVRV